MEKPMFLREIAWTEVLNSWREREAHMGWERVYRPRGFAGWDDWRRTHYQSLGLHQRTWKLYQINRPEIFVPALWAVVYRGWKPYYPTGQAQATLGQIAKHPDFLTNLKVKDLLESFPIATTLIVLKCGDDYALFEGMHRASAIAFQASRGQSVKTNLTITLTEFNETERDLFAKSITQRTEPENLGA